MALNVIDAAVVGTMRRAMDEISNTQDLSQTDRLLEDTDPMLGRKILKFINDEYLLKDQTEFH